MFEVLTDKLTLVFRRLSGKGRLTEKEVDEALREVRLALLEADVHFRVVGDFIGRVRERAVKAEVLESLTPAQHVIKIVNDELIATLGPPGKLAPAERRPSVAMLVGLQGSGKTTSAAKLALHLQRTGQKPLLVAADLRRPAAIEQLETLGRQLNLPVYEGKGEGDAVLLCGRAKEMASQAGYQWLIVDTGGRLHIDEELMEELMAMKKALEPSETLLVVDAMTGQDALRSGQDFHSKVGLTGLILTKLDGDARGGAALSIASVTGVPIKFVGIGERPEALEPFYPDRIASRILGMGDVLTLVEKAQATFDQSQAKVLERKMRKEGLDLEDFLGQLQQMKKMGPLSQILEMVPGFASIKRRLTPEATDEGQLKKAEAIILSMTPRERRNPAIIDGSRRRRIARGSGSTPQDVSHLINQFREVQKLMRQMSGTKGRTPPRF